MLIILIVLQALFIFVNILRICRRHCSKHCLNDIQLRLISLLSSLFSLLFLIIIIIQFNGNRLTEPLEFLESMRRHYSRIQIYTFSKDLEIIIQQVENALDLRIGASYISIVIILFLTFVSFLTSITVEVKISSKSPSMTFTDDEEKKNDISVNHENHISLTAERFLQPKCFPQSERFVPSELIRYKRQTKV